MDNIKLFPFLLISVFFYAPNLCNGRLIHGVFKPHNGVLHLTRFCFQGAAAIEYQVNDTSSANLYLYSDQQWDALPSISHCIEKLKHSSYNVELKENNGKYSLQPSLSKPTFLHVALADPSQCSSSNSSLQHMSYTLNVFNPDSQGTPANHFSYEDSGLLTFYQLVLLGYIIGACIYGNRLWQTVCKGGPMHLAIKILTIAMVFHALGALCHLLNFLWFSRNGEGKFILDLMSATLAGLSQYQALVMMFSMSVGWTLSSATMFDAKEEKLVNNVIIGVSILQVIFSYWELIGFLVGARLIICGAIAYNVKKTVAKERSALRRDFYGKFIIDCYIWWLSYPLMAVIAVIFAEYSRKKLIYLERLQVRQYQHFLCINCFYQGVCIGRCLHYQQQHYHLGWIEVSVRESTQVDLSMLQWKKDSIL